MRAWLRAWQKDSQKHEDGQKELEKKKVDDRDNLHLCKFELHNQWQNSWQLCKGTLKASLYVNMKFLSHLKTNYILKQQLRCDLIIERFLFIISFYTLRSEEMKVSIHNKKNKIEKGLERQKCCRLGWTYVGSEWAVGYRDAHYWDIITQYIDYLRKKRGLEKLNYNRAVESNFLKAWKGLLDRGGGGGGGEGRKGYILKGQFNKIFVFFRRMSTLGHILRLLMFF